MNEIDLINLKCEQPIPRIGNEELNALIQRDFPNNTESIKEKLSSVRSDSEAGKNRISASILKLANADPGKIDKLIDQANYDYRDIIVAGEYPRMRAMGFELFEQEEEIIKKTFLEDWVEYSEWRKK